MATRPRFLALAERVLGIDASGERELFPAYTEVATKVPQRVWQVLRLGSIAGYLALIGAMFVSPESGLYVLFGVIVPLLPILFLVAPGLWRNVCPLAATNQLPRLLGFSRGRTAPEWLRKRGYEIAVMLFVGIVAARLAGLDGDGAAMGGVLTAIFVAAFTGGVLLKGKSGWCGSICPLLPLQRAYGQTPYVTVPNSHCAPCVGCVKNCYDFKPRAAYQADLADADPGWSVPRKLFVAALPGFVLGFFTLSDAADVATSQRFSLLMLFVLVSVGAFHVIDAIWPLNHAMLTVTYAATALNIFYWFIGPRLTGAVGRFTGLHAGWLRWLITVAVATVTLLWVARTRVSELQFAFTTRKRSEPVLLRAPTWRKPATDETAARVRFGADGVEVPAEVGMSLLDIAEKRGQPIEAGCRMGVCGADPVAVLDGMSCLSPPEHDEVNTLRRLGLGKSTRMACCARIGVGAVTVSLTPEPGDGVGSAPTRYDRSIRSVVVIGNGIAGVTAADHIRRGHPHCDIHLVGQEPHALYNRMGISRLVHGRSAMQGLYLLPDQWYKDHGVTAWLNTVVSRIELRSRRVVLGMSESLPYDRLILAMGASAARPTTAGLDRPGSFVLREAADAMRIRAYAQQRGCERAVVAGGGLLGLEAAYSLHLLGLKVTVLERGDRLLRREVDEMCSDLVADHFARVGIDILRGVEATHVAGTPAVTGVALTNNRILACDVFLAATGIRANVDLARQAGVPIRRGVLVNARMQTRVPDVFAAGDVAEQDGQVPGRWPIAMEQARAAAVNALGGDVEMTAETPATILKDVGLELFTIGRIQAEHNDEVIVVARPDIPSYRRLVLRDGRAVGATILGHHPGDLSAAQKAVRNKSEVGVAAQAALSSGDWSVLGCAC